jgi:hypothetical protein
VLSIVVLLPPACILSSAVMLLAQRRREQLPNLKDAFQHGELVAVAVVLTTRVTWR